MVPRASSRSPLPGAVPGLEELLARWEALRGDMRRARDGVSYFSFAHERRAFESTQVDVWLRLILDHLGEQPPAAGVP